MPHYAYKYVTRLLFVNNHCVGCMWRNGDAYSRIALRKAVLGCLAALMAATMMAGDAVLQQSFSLGHS
jgi:hypothetical protein